MRGRRETRGRQFDRRARVATVNREAGRRSAYERCPCCKKLRMKHRPASKWMLLNSQVRPDGSETYVLWPKTPFGRVCQVCAGKFNYIGYEVDAQGVAAPKYLVGT